ncbi:cbb3-type cytochrome oxidase assembly protein CcoS [bacterium]|nr:cbb3-type cytochrome oxidase assembly protein CcoS [bacterium]
MSVILVLLGAGLVVALVFLGLFIWAVNSGQYDDPVTPGWRIILDDMKKKNSKDTGKHLSREDNDVP